MDDETKTLKVCACHGEPMYRNNSSGGWRCRVKVRARQNPADLAYWHRADGGYIVRRKRDLARQRSDVLERLTQLREAA